MKQLKGGVELKVPRQSELLGHGVVPEDGYMPEQKFNLTERLIAVQIFKPTETRGGLQIPETARSIETVRARVLFVGLKTEYGLKRGDVVLLFRDSQIEPVDHDGDKFWVIDERHTMGIEIPTDK